MLQGVCEAASDTTKGSLVGGGGGGAESGNVDDETGIEVQEGMGVPI